MTPKEKSLLDNIEESATEILKLVKDYRDIATEEEEYTNPEKEYLHYVEWTRDYADELSRNVQRLHLLQLKKQKNTMR